MDKIFHLDDSNFYKTIINTQIVLSEASGKTSGFNSNVFPDLGIVTRSSNQDQTLTNESSYLNIDYSNLLSSTVVTSDNKTLEEKLKTSLSHDSIISNIESDDDKIDTDVINQDIPKIVNNEDMAIAILNS